MKSAALLLAGALAASGGQYFVAPTGELFRAAPGDPYPARAWFKGADRDGDGRLTRAEFLADGDRYFRALDSDGNGELDGFEVEAYERDVLGALPKRPGPGRPPPGAGPPAGGAPPAGKPKKPAGPVPSRAGFFALFDVPQPVKAADRDLNARVTRDEYLHVLSLRFQRLDTAGRGFLLFDSLPETPAQTAPARGEATAPPRP